MRRLWHEAEWEWITWNLEVLRVLTSLVRASVWLLFSFVIVVAILALTAGLPDKIKLAKKRLSDWESRGDESKKK